MKNRDQFSEGKENGILWKRSSLGRDVFASSWWKSNAASLWWSSSHAKNQQWKGQAGVSGRFGFSPQLRYFWAVWHGADCLTSLSLGATSTCLLKSNAQQCLSHSEQSINVISCYFWVSVIYLEYGCSKGRFSPYSFLHPGSRTCGWHSQSHLNNNSQHLFTGPSCVPSTVLSMSWALTHSTLITILWEWCYNYP